MFVTISRNVRYKTLPKQKSWGEIASPRTSKNFSHYALVIAQPHGKGGSIDDNSIEDWNALKEKFGGEAFVFTAAEWKALCGTDNDNMAPVGAQFTRHYHILLFNM